MGEAEMLTWVDGVMAMSAASMAMAATNNAASGRSGGQQGRSAGHFYIYLNIFVNRAWESRYRSSAAACEMGNGDMATCE
jgi:nicotinamide mononucleotide (NMN) deamidase PncC